MNVKSEEIINFANKVCRMCLWGLYPIVSQDVDQIVDQIE